VPEVVGGELVAERKLDVVASACPCAGHPRVFDPFALGMHELEHGVEVTPVQTGVSALTTSTLSSDIAYARSPAASRARLGLFRSIRPSN
jgi:hypothetical protein